MFDIFFTDSNKGIIVGDAGTILITTDKGMNWNQQLSGTTYDLLDIFFINANTGTIVGEDGIILRTTNGGVSVNQMSSEIPENFYLHQNYPNPFNPTTKIKFDIKQTSNTKLIIYNILGKEIATLVNEKLNAGSYEVSWKGSNYPSGVYFYKLVTMPDGRQADGFSDVKKMILVK